MKNDMIFLRSGLYLTNDMPWRTTTDWNWRMWPKTDLEVSLLLPLWFCWRILREKNIELFSYCYSLQIMWSLVLFKRSHWLVRNDPVVLNKKIWAPVQNTQQPIWILIWKSQFSLCLTYRRKWLRVFYHDLLFIHVNTHYCITYKF